MARVFICIFMLASLFSYTPKAGAWSDEIEGVMMPSHEGRDDMSDGSEIMENLNESPETESYDGPLINAEGGEVVDE